VTLCIQVNVSTVEGGGAGDDVIVIAHMGEELRFGLFRRPGDAARRVRVGLDGPPNFHVRRERRGAAGAAGETP